ncbi:MAG: ABC-type transport auxiliary lipoprotein family protein [Pseudomonadota bacterium]
MPGAARVALTVALAVALAACASKAPPPTLYDFGPPPATVTAVAAGLPGLPSLVVADVSGPSWLDSQRMYYRLLYADAQQSRPYAQNQWNAPPLQLLGQRLKSRIAQSGVKVLSATDAAASVALLRVEVDDFAQNFDSQTSSSAQLTLRASLFRGHTLVDQKSFTRREPAVSADALGGAKALAGASDAVAADLIAWLGGLAGK